MAVDILWMKMVKRSILSLFLIRMIYGCKCYNSKVYFLLGGLAHNSALLDSSEFYVEGDTKWTLFTGLNPVKYGFKSLVLENRIFIIGDWLN